MEHEEVLKGHLHPLTIVQMDVNRIFTEMGFTIAQGPEIETEFYNFDALNIPEHHPARDMWDTFWLKPLNAKKLLRTHTSPVQIRYMEKNKPPIRIVAPGKTFRHEATDATHEAQFFQLEGLVVGENISLANLKSTLEIFFGKFFGKTAGLRLRPTYFPFVEPGVEIDMTCFKCDGKGLLSLDSSTDETRVDLKICPVCKGGKFVEIMGAGIVHPKVLENAGIDPKKFTGFAFGGGIDRLAMLKYGIDDIRLLYEGDLRIVNQF